jgi:UDP-2-acetamido-3-amino-2,3-dideoxy-glucuronate N-acetyltransferase
MTSSSKKTKNVKKNLTDNRLEEMHYQEILKQGCEIAAEVSLGKYCSIGKNVKIGNYSKIGQNVCIEEGVEIGEYCDIQNNVYLPEGLICGNHVVIGHSTVFTKIHYPHRQHSLQQKREQLTTKLHHGVRIGANVTILDGLELGKYSMIGSATFVTNDVKPYALIMGNPHKQTGWVSEHGAKLNFLNRERTSVCPISGWLYRLEGKYVIKLAN